jgi:1-deoxy-D-xylulose-5-phosphate reductoisomerase
MMQVVNPKRRTGPSAAPAVRTVTVLGATGSVGMSTVDLLKRGNGKYRVEAVTANKNAADLAKIARALNARVAVVADPSAYRELKDALSGTGIQAASGEAAVIEAAERPADWLMAAVSGAVGLKPTLAAV